MIDDNLRYSGTIPDERLHDMHRDLRSPMGGGHGGSGGSGPRGAGVFLVDQVFTRSQDDTYQATKSAFLNPLHKASYGVRIGDIVLFYLNTEGILCTGIVIAISGETVTFVKHDEISTVGFSPSIATTEIPGGHRVTVTNEGGSNSFDVMDGVQGSQGEPFEFDDFTPEQLEDLRSEIASVFYRKQETHVTISDVPTSVVHIPFSDYTSSSILFVDIEGLSLCENVDYVINGDDIELVSPITHANTIVNFKMLIVVALTQQDLDNIVASGIVDDVAEMVLTRFGDELPVATQETNGLMSSSDKTKLDGIAENANNYSLPTMSVSTKGGAMVGDGLAMTGDALGIADAIRKGYVRSFETVVDMQASTTLEDGMTCHINGFHAAGDGGAAYYTVTESGTANGTSVIACANGLFAHFMPTTGLVSIDAYPGETNEDKLFAALDDVTSGTIVCGDVTITKVYNAKAKDYRNIIIQGATLNLTVDAWFNQANSTYKTVVQFDSCVINGGGHTIFSGEYNAVGMRFNGCTLNNVTAFSSASKYVQSPYFIDCTMFGVGNLITATIAYDFKMIGCRVESATETLIKFTDSSAIRQGSVESCLIEGRNSVVFDIGGAIGFSISRCYFEANLNGILLQSASNGACYITIEECDFFGGIDADYAVTLNSSAYQNIRMRNNVSNYASGKLLCNRNSSPANYLGANNRNYVHSWANDGFGLTGNSYTTISTSAINATWDSDNSVWKCPIQLPYGEAYTLLRPLYLVFAGSFGSAAIYQGFAIVRLTPRIAFTGGTQKIVCDAEIVDSCNSGSATKTSTVTANVTISNDAYNASDVMLTVEIGGFRSNRGQYKVIDPFTTIDLITVKP